MRKLIPVEEKEIDPLKRAFGLAIHPENPDIMVSVSGAAYFHNSKTGQLRRLNKKKSKKTRRTIRCQH